MWPEVRRVTEVHKEDGFGEAKAAGVCGQSKSDEQFSIMSPISSLHYTHKGIIVLLFE